MRTYETFEEIDNDLKKLKLERDIAVEELKIVKHNFDEFLKPINWLTTVFRMVSKYGFLLVIKKIFK
jgi:hypothetical protein